LARDSGVERIWFVRHGQTSDNIRNRRRRATAEEFNRLVRNSGDSMLTAEGERQIGALIEHFQQRPLLAIHSSPMKRALQSAGILAEGLRLPVITVEGLHELVAAEHHLRLFRGRRHALRVWFWRSMVRQFLGRPAGAESLWDARRRVWKAWQTVVAAGPAPDNPGAGGPGPEAGTERLVIAHQGTIMMLKSLLKRDASWRISRYNTENGGITEIIRC
jgi:broad specificity phosphatase PhoE